ncbi:dethiobiotin synthase [Salinimonas marina]|uniref:ATP-dependent dethiobiotin synthetase BioD n=1 Tax=Salinimonas marina TaxID=2785918 RepID=A0A7S9DWW9_9ALTE|nr:dethiobiotin synthase [Salinimonas marina]QPG04750.1 dethiobiotin synthase [Salinimonas marina]
MQSFFITGTDTEVGKTYFTARLMHTLASEGHQVAGYKPVAAGCELINNEPVNEDAQAIYNACTVPATLQQVNPIALMPPIAPHIAATEAGVTLKLSQLVAGYRQLAAYQPDVLLMEGAGGWQLPLGNNLWMPDVVKHLKLPVIIVVGMRLGCLNHALLTARAITQAGLSIHGWVANQLTPQPMLYYAENLATLREAMPAPLLAELPFEADVTRPLATLRDILR